MTACMTCDLTARRHQGPLCENIYEDEYWRVVHAFNTSQPGWLVVVLLRHVTSFAELTGRRIFDYLGVPEAEVVPLETRNTLAARLQPLLQERTL